MEEKGGEAGIEIEEGEEIEEEEERERWENDNVICFFFFSA